MTTDPIKAKIQELCPDVMELKFGCEVEDQDSHWTILKVFQDELIVWRPISGIGKGKTVEFEILGSPITLVVVLRAIGRRENFSLHLEQVKAGEWCVQLKHMIDDNYFDCGYWNLEHDNYDQQSEECKQFIGSLLGV